MSQRVRWKAESSAAGDDQQPPGAVLAQCLAGDMAQVRPAQRVEECVVGPADAERALGQPSWSAAAVAAENSASSSRIPNRKRKARGSADDDTASPPTSSSFRHAVRTFLSSGCAIIPSVLPPHFVAHCKEVATADFDFISNTVGLVKQHAISTSNPNLLAASANVDFREVLDRDGGRRDVRLYHGNGNESDSLYGCSGLIYNPIVYPLVRELLGGGDVNLLYAGVMWGMGGQKAPENHQRWHGDGGHLFDHVHLPPHCINVFYPLVQLDEDIGPTEVQAGSHILGKFTSPDGGTFALTCRDGDAVLFDYRIKHRGMANNMQFDRPVLYLAYSKPYFRDVGNTRSTKSLFDAAVEANRDQYCGVRSPPWRSRILSDSRVRMGRGFEWSEQDTATCRSCVEGAEDAAGTAELHYDGSGERSIRFRMNVELPESEAGAEPSVITFYDGDISTEVAATFCREHSLSADFVVLLANMIQQQADAYAHGSK